MRANEFVVNENYVTDLGQWLDKQVISKKLADVAKAKKKYLPRFANEIQKLLAAKANNILQKSGADIETRNALLTKMVIDTMKKSTKIDVTRNKEIFGGSVETLVDAVLANPTGFSDTNLVQDVVDKSFNIKTATETSEENIIKLIAKYTKEGMSPTEAAAKAFKDVGMPEQEAEEIAKNAPPGPVTAPSADGIDEEFLEKFIDNVKEHLFRKNHEIDLRDPESVADFIEFNIDKHKEQLEITSLDQTEKIVSDLLKDPDMAFNFTPEKNFRGLVYSPGGLKYKRGAVEGENTAFVQDSNDAWSIWEMQSTTSWRLKEKLVDIIQLKSLEGLKGEMIPKAFRHDQTGGQSNLYRVSNR